MWCTSRRKNEKHRIYKPTARISGRGLFLSIFFPTTECQVIKHYFLRYANFCTLVTLQVTQNQAKQLSWLCYWLKQRGQKTTSMTVNSCLQTSCIWMPPLQFNTFSKTVRVVRLRCLVNLNVKHCQWRPKCPTEILEHLNTHFNRMARSWH